MTVLTVEPNPPYMPPGQFECDAQGFVATSRLTVSCPFGRFSTPQRLLKGIGVPFEKVTAIMNDANKWFVSVPAGTRFGPSVSLVQRA